MKYTQILQYSTGILIILILTLCVSSYSRTEGFSSQSTIPAILWTYWNSNTIPDVVQRCIDSWAYHNPTYEIHVVTPANLYDYIDIDIKDLKFNELAPKINPIEDPGKRGFIWAINEDFQPYLRIRSKIL